MTHHASRRFWQAYDALPDDIRDLADKAYDLLEKNPQHPSLQFKRVGKLWSARVCRGYRALAKEVDDGLLWFWIGPPDEYIRLIQRRQ